MSFAWPHLLWLLLVPAALLAWELTRRRRARAASHPKILRAEAGARSLDFKGTDDQPIARARPRYWLCLGLALVVAALARPQWGRLEEPVFDQSREILLAIDLSRSMLTPDVPPSRLARSKLLIQSLLEKLQGERVGLAVFSGTAFLQSPLSADYEILREFLPALGPEFLPEGGTNYRALIDTALAAFGTSNTADRFLIILSDGEATDENWKERMPDLKKKGIRVIGLGIGTAGGGMIPDGSGGFVKDDRGAVVLSKLENSTLQELAQATGGVYRDASSWLDLASLIKETVEAGQKGKFVEKNTVRLAERFQWPLAFGLWFLLVSFFSEFPVRPRPRDIRLTPHPTGSQKPATGKLPATAAALLVVLLCALRFPPSAVAAPAPAVAPGAPAAAGAPAAPASPAAPLAKIVGRVAASDARTARDWSELGHETVIWGSHLQGEQQPVPEGPVRDALAAVDTGAKLDPKATDWAKLRQDLEALLQKPQDQKPDPKDQKPNQDQKNQDQKDQKDQKQNQQKSDQPQQRQDQKDQQQQKQDQQNQKSDDPKQSGESAFGDMQKKDQPPPPPPPQESGTQKVGGEKKDQPPEQADPSLALPLQKLDQLRNQDSPAQLFQLMDGEKKPGQKKAGKDW
jgi:Ca-activated chloride channel family protein